MMRRNTIIDVFSLERAIIEIACIIIKLLYCIYIKANIKDSIKFKKNGMFIAEIITRIVKFAKIPYIY